MMTDNKGTDWMLNPGSEINREADLLGKKEAAVNEGFDDNAQLAYRDRNV